MPGGATEREICYQWRDVLGTRSRQDTQQTQDEWQVEYARHIAVCEPVIGGI